ncbi:putative methyltransferase [Dishui Lake large algae virus 1]|nr:putative methyltransferase [Dishui Lake large algae virus 1]
MELIRFPPETTVRTEKLTFEQIDSIPYIDENGGHVDHKNAERDEQLVAKQYIQSTDSVLELGGRFGTVSAVINNMLDDPMKHIVIEPDKNVIPSLLENRNTHNSYFTVYQNIICNKPKNLICACYATRVVDVVDNDTQVAPSMKLQDLIDYHGFDFNVLVADCEGCMEEFVKDNMEFIRRLRMITYEQDFEELSNYKNVSNMLRELGFRCVRNAFHMVWLK